MKITRFIKHQSLRITVFGVLLGVVSIVLGIAGPKYYENKQFESDLIVSSDLTKEADLLYQNKDYEQAIKQYDEIAKRMLGYANKDKSKAVEYYIHSQLQMGLSYNLLEGSEKPLTNLRRGIQAIERALNVNYKDSVYSSCVWEDRGFLYYRLSTLEEEQINLSKSIEYYDESIRLIEEKISKGKSEENEVHLSAVKLNRTRVAGILAGLLEREKAAPILPNTPTIER